MCWCAAKNLHTHSIVNDRETLNSGRGLHVRLILFPVWWINVSEMPSSWNSFFELVVQNICKPCCPRNALDLTLGRFHGWYRAASYVASVAWTRAESQRASPINSSDKYHVCRESFLLVAADIAACGYLSSCSVSLKSFRVHQVPVVLSSRLWGGWSQRKWQHHEYHAPLKTSFSTGCERSTSWLCR